MAQRILVTGGSGFIAGQTILALLNKGYTVRATVRAMNKVDAIADLVRENGGNVNALEYAVADLTSDDNWDKAIAGCDGVFHMASPFPLNMPEDPQELIGPAVDGTLRVLTAASKAGVRRVVLTSSIAAVAYGQGGRDSLFTEADWTNTEGPDVTPYVQSKTFAEKAAWDFAEKTDIQLSAINPGLVLGPVLDPRHGTSVELIKMMMSGAMPAAPNFGFNIADVRDVAAAHIAAFESTEAIGKRFNCCDSWMMMNEVGQTIKSTFPKEGRKAPTATLPSWLVRVMAMFDKSLRQILIDLDKKRAADNTQMRSILGITPVAAEDSVRETAKSLIEHGLAGKK
jgi:dihydroflavonol-4-reductase